ncbi:DUF4349 domain-containing protein [Camelliibacillus cellulosilyticus]|uniref:DUF4349 domain-containing protein n=1 Tax=Camelliibacillus cellulosilyticus TaxID=2174486 RepID=A0ABV9GQY0_9BACL
MNTFLTQAKETKDLLSISEKLADVQADIEQIKGEMNYLKNHSELSTVTIHFIEKSAKLKQEKDLNTWEKTKQAFIASINAIITFFSGIVIFVLGYSPILLPLVLIALAIYFIIKYRQRMKK